MPIKYTVIDCQNIELIHDLYEALASMYLSKVESLYAHISLLLCLILDP